MKELERLETDRREMISKIDMLTRDNSQRLEACHILKMILGDPEATAYIYCKSRNLPNTDTQNYSTDLR